jgi:hypothetical protein
MYKISCENLLMIKQRLTRLTGYVRHNINIKCIEHWHCKWKCNENDDLWCLFVNECFRSDYQKLNAASPVQHVHYPPYVPLNSNQIPKRLKENLQTFQNEPYRPILNEVLLTYFYTTGPYCIWDSCNVGVLNDWKGLHWHAIDEF